jgi:predicted O-methyltransferase YrrM
VALAGTAAYDGLSHLPGLVAAALRQANALGFEHSCRPEQGRLLKVLAAGRRGGVIGETGTGCGVGLGWMASEADADTTLVSVEIDLARAAAAASVFSGHPNITVVQADWTALLEHGPFDLLVLDGGNAGKGADAAAGIGDQLILGGTVVIDDFTPSTEWPPLHEGEPDHSRVQWFEHPALQATEVKLAPDLAAVVATRVR